MKLSPQKELIISILRDMQWHCSSEFGYIKDDRKRISELNATYMEDKGYEIIGEPCDGRCGIKHSSGLFMRKAQRKKGMTPTEFVIQNNRNLEWFRTLVV